MAATLADIARKAGVSASTVSRVLNRTSAKNRISAATEASVLRAAEALNYQPNQLARGLRVRTSHSIGLVVPDISNPFFSYITRSIQSTAHKLGYSLMVCDTNEDLALEVEQIGLLRSKGVDGMVIMPVGQKSSHIEMMLEEKVPVVLVDRTFDKIRADAVIVDNYRGAFDAVEHLIQHGHSRIAIIQGLPDTYTNNGRLRGYGDAMKKYGIPVDESLIVGKDFRKENGYIETKLLLHLERPPTAIFATSDLITLGVLEALFEDGVRVPEDMSLMAFDDIDFGPYLFCALTTVAQPKENMGEIAVKLLVDRMKKHSMKDPKQIVLNPRLIIRSSVRHIRQLLHAGEPVA